LVEFVEKLKKTCWVADLGLMAYAPACELQQRLVAARKVGVVPDLLIFCEHPHTITLGRNGKRENLRVSEHLLAQKNVEFHASDRGGDVTYHGPGQIVGYPILDLAEHREDRGRDVRWYVQQLEETMIRATADFGVSARRSEAGHGVWMDAPTGAGMDAGEEKLAALGVHLSRWVTSHGFAYNVCTDLRYFDLIVPCGIGGKRATSLERALGRAVSSEEVRARLAERFGEVFQCAMVSVTRAELEAKWEEALEPEEVGAVKGREA
jgi:lipoate-protein ligase B